MNRKLAIALCLSVGLGALSAEVARVLPAVGANFYGNPVQPVAGDSFGSTPYHLPGGTTASTNSHLIKNAAGNLMAMVALNTTTTTFFLKLYDSASAPTCSSATGLAHVYPIPPPGFVLPLPVAGESYTTGIGYCVTGGGADTDATNAATGVFIEASYK
jgi:hypothetical protein